MIYASWQAQADLMVPMRLAAGAANAWLGFLPTPVARLRPLRELSAAYTLLAKTQITHVRPPFGIDTVEVEGRPVAVVEEAVRVKPFGTLLRFAKPGVEGQPKLLLVAPMACHFATLLRDTARTLLADHDVHITDWHNARDVALSDGHFDLDDYIAHLIEFLQVLGPDVHVVAICQPCVAALAATALMAEGGDPATPASLTLMAGPVDTRISPTEVNRFAQQHDLAWFERTVIDRVPLRYRGAGRRVYPGFLQLAGFMGLNPQRHRDAFLKLYRHMADGERTEADAIQSFYDEYFAVCDLPAEFYLDTMQRVFMDPHLATGRFRYRGRTVRPEAITRTRLLTVEGARDDICGVGQTAAAQALCSGLDDALKTLHVQDGAGHYGVFSGRRWTQSVFPLLRSMIADASA